MRSPPHAVAEHDHLLYWLCFGAVVARCATGYFLPNIVHPDEIFQYLEQSYRLVTGRGLTPWEYQVGARSWLLAWLVYPVVWLTHAATPNPAVLRFCITLFLSLLATTGVLAAYRIGRIVGGRTHARYAALLVACWCELVYFSTHLLADTISAIPLLAALAVGRLGRDARSLDIIASGFLFGLTIALRPQLAPACAIAGLWTAGWKPGTRWLAMAAGVLLALLLLGITDWISWGAPFHSIRTYLTFQASGLGAASETDPTFYLKGEAALWGLATPLILLTAAAGFRRSPLLGIVTFVLFGMFSVISYREPRLLYPALPILFTSCGIGTAELVQGLAPRIKPFTERQIGVAVMFGWLLLSLVSGVRGTMRPMWLDGEGMIRAFDIASADPAACAIGIDPPDQWVKTGMVRIRADMRLYGATIDTAPQFNYLVSPNYSHPAWFAAAGFTQVTCFAKTCLFKRSGSCRYSPDEILARPSTETAGALKRLKMN